MVVDCFFGSISRLCINFFGLESDMSCVICWSRTYMSVCGICKMEYVMVMVKSFGRVREVRYVIGNVAYSSFLQRERCGGTCPTWYCRMRVAVEQPTPHFPSYMRPSLNF